MDSINQVKAAKTKAENKIIEAVKDFEKTTKHLILSGTIQLRFEDGRTLCQLNADLFDDVKPVSNIVAPTSPLKALK